MVIQTGGNNHIGRCLHMFITYSEYFYFDTHFPSVSTSVSDSWTSTLQHSIVPKLQLCRRPSHCFRVSYMSNRLTAETHAHYIQEK